MARLGRPLFHGWAGLERGPPVAWTTQFGIPWIQRDLARSTWLSLALAAWFSLDFLGFSRPKRDFSMGYGRLTVRNFFAVPFPLSNQRLSVKNRNPSPLSVDGKVSIQRAHETDYSRYSDFQQEIDAAYSAS
jgi:hypothetical protein